MKEATQRIAMRSMIGRAKTTEIRTYLSTAFTGVMQEAQRAMENRRSVFENLFAFRKIMHSETGEIPSQADLCATYITTHIFKGYTDEAQERLNKRDAPSFRFFYDFAAGIGEVTSKIYMGIEQQNGSFPQTFHESRSVTESILNEDSLDTRGDDFQTQMDEAEQAGRLIQVDPSGFLLIDETVQNLEQDLPEHLRDCEREYVAAGAKLAAYLYKNSYEIIGILYD